MKNEKLICLLCAGVILTYSTTAKDKSKGHGEHGKGKPEAKEVQPENTKVLLSTKAPEPALKFAISSGEREIMRRYATGCVEPDNQSHGKGKSLPPGLAKKVARGGGLPPGWEKKLTTGAVMPPDVYKECHPLPKDLTIKLPSPPKGTITVMIEGKAVRLLEATREILDVFDILPH